MDQKIEVAIGQGSAYSRALDLMKQMTVNTEVESEEYIITLASEEAEGLYYEGEGEVKWVVPEEGDNQHLEIAVRDKKDLRFIPYLNVHITLYNKDNKKVIEETELPFLWHPFLHHYGSNVKLPGEGEYSAEVVIEAPEFGRHDEIAGKRYKNKVRVSLEPIHLKPGRKEHGSE